MRQTYADDRTGELVGADVLAEDFTSLWDALQQAADSARHEGTAECVTLAATCESMMAVMHERFPGLFERAFGSAEE